MLCRVCRPLRIVTALTYSLPTCAASRSFTCFFFAVPGTADWSLESMDESGVRGSGRLFSTSLDYEKEDLEKTDVEEVEDNPIKR